MFGSYIYINMSLMRLFGDRVPGFTPEAVDLQYFGKRFSDLANTLTIPD